MQQRVLNNQRLRPKRENDRDVSTLHRVNHERKLLEKRFVNNESIDI